MLCGGSARAPWMPCPHGWEWWPIWPQDFGCGKEGSPWSVPLQRGPSHWHPKQNQPVYPPPESQPLWSQRKLYSTRSWPWCQGEDYQHPLALPYVGKWVQTTSSRGCWLSYEHTTRIPTGSHLLGVPGVNCLPLPSDKGGVISMPNPGHGTNILITNPVQILRPTWLLSMDWWALRECNVLYMTHKSLHHSLTPRWTQIE